MATCIFSSFYFVTLSSTCIVAAAEAFSPSELNLLPFSSWAQVNNNINKYPTRTSNTAPSLHVTCSHPRGGAIMMKSSTSKNDSKQQDDESLLLQKESDSMKFCYRAAFFSILVKIFTQGPLQNHSIASLPQLISFWILAFSVLRLEYGKFIGRMPRR
jgi:hypothetical protein